VEEGGRKKRETWINWTPVTNKSKSVIIVNIMIRRWRGGEGRREQAGPRREGEGRRQREEGNPN